jgi:hypothetical protein
MNDAMKIALMDMESEGFDVDLFDNGERSKENTKTTKKATKGVEKVRNRNGKRRSNSF